MPIAGIDIGKASDPTAIVITDDWSVRRAYRIALGTDYGVIAEHMADLSRAGHQVWADATGVGVAVIDRARELGAAVQAVSITGGKRIRHEGDRWSVPKSALVGMMRAPKLSLALLPTAEQSVLKAEMVAFEIQARGRTLQFNAASGRHDDLVLALSLACLGSLFAQWAVAVPKASGLRPSSEIQTIS